MRLNKLMTTVIAALMCNMAIAQSFFVPTAYRGAFAPSPAAMWTNTWCNWDPQNTTYPSATVTINSNITSNTTWTTGTTYLLSGQIFVTNGAELTIQPGVKVLGDKASAGAGLFITRGSKIHAVGTVSQPIVFTSNQAKGARSTGDWGGIILMGAAKINPAGGVAYIEGFANSTNTQYGGTNDADNSGELQYVRIEFGGYVYQPNKEINGLTIGGVGSGTTIDHIQTSFTNDDAFEWFGGTVNCKYLVSYRDLDDCFDTDFGYSGNVQFCLAVRDPNIADNPSVSTSEGFESDNDATGSSNNPQTSARFSNITLIGPYRGSTTNTIASGYRRGARIRKNSALKIYNSIFMDFGKGLHIDASASENNATNGLLKFKNNIIAGCLAATEVNSGSTFNITSFLSNNNNSVYTSASGILTTPYSYTLPDYRPATNSVALTGADFTDVTMTNLVLFAPTVAADTISNCISSTIAPLTATAISGNTLHWWGTYATGGTYSLTAPTPSNIASKTYYVSQANPAGIESARTAIFSEIKKLVGTPLSITGKTIDLCNNVGYMYFVTTPAANALSYTWVLPANTSLISTSEKGDTAYISFDSLYTVNNIGVKANNTCGSSTTRLLKVQTKPTTPGVISGVAMVCSIRGTSNYATYSILPVAGINSYNWTVPANAAIVSGAGLNSIDVTFASNFVTGNILVASQGACLSSASKSFKASTNPAFATANKIAGNTAVCDNATETYTIGSVIGATTYTWTIPAGATVVSGQGSQTLVLTFGSSYVSGSTLKVRATNTCGGSAYKSLIINKVSCTRSSNLNNNVEVSSINSASVYPNPVTNNFVINYVGTTNSTVNVFVYDVLGQVVLTSTATIVEGSNSINMSSENLSNGMYSVKIIDATTNQVQSVNFVK